MPRLLLRDVLRPAVEGVEERLVRSIEEVSSVCGEKPCLVTLEVGGKVYELIVVGGGIVAARRVDGGVVYGDAVVRELRGLLPAPARLARLRDRVYEWRDEEFTVGIRGIDLQHRQLVRALNALYRALIEGKASHAYETLVFMGEYAGFHFSTEERLFERYGYPKAEEHRKAHAAFIAKTEEFRRLLRDAGLDAAIEMVVYLADWTRGHILGMDRDYAKWLGRIK